MRNGSLEQQTVDQVFARVPGASSVLRSYGIDPTNRMSLAQAAAAVSVTPDAVLAVLEDQLRRRASLRSHDEFMEEPELELAVNA
jgi:hypothetical protein